MPANSWGSRFVVTSFGESHGEAMGVVIDGCPAGVPFDRELLLHNLQRRRPGQHGDPQRVVSVRSEEDMPQILSGIFADKTLGTPIALLVYNKDQRSQDYDQIAHQPRPGHADDVWREKFTHVDHRGGGRERRTAYRGKAGAGQNARERETATEPAEPRIRRAVEVATDAGAVDERAHQNEQRNDREAVVGGRIDDPLRGDRERRVEAAQIEKPGPAHRQHGEGER